MIDRESKILLSEDVSPQDVAVLALIQTYSHFYKSEVGTEPLGISIIQFIFHEPLHKSPEEIVVIPTASDLCEKIRQDVTRYSMGQTEDQILKTVSVLNQHLLQVLWRIDSVESLDTSVMGMLEHICDPSVVSYDEHGNNGEHLSKMKFSPRSTIGSFIQRIVASLHLLHFDELFLLFEAYVSYREPTRVSVEMPVKQVLVPKVIPNDVIRCKSQQEDEEMFLKLKGKLDTALESDISFPRDLTKSHEVDLMSVSKYDLQALLSSYITILETYGERPPAKLKNIMKLMTSSSSSLYSIQSANLSSVPSYYYIRFLECLYEKDYQGSMQALHQYFDYMVSNKSKYFYHYALISRATLHQFFGEDEKALDAIEEAISVAREHRDNPTLTFVLNWLFNFMRDKPELWNVQNFYHNNNESHLLDFLVKKSKTVSLSLYATSYHFEALHIIDNGGSMNKYLESLTKATYISIHDSIPSFVKSMEMASVVWSRIGNLSLSELYLELASEFAAVSGKRSDQVGIKVRRAYLDYMKGNTEEGYRELQDLKPQGKSDLSIYKPVAIHSSIVLTRMYINKGRLKEAEKLIQLLDNDEVQDIEVRSELVHLNAQVQSAIGNNSKALNSIFLYSNQMETQMSQNKSNMLANMRLNLLKCRIFTESGAHMRTLSLLVQQLEHAKKVGFISIVVEGTIIFSSILNNSESFVDAYNVLRSKLTTTLSVQNMEFSSMAYYELSRSCCYILKSPTLLEEVGSTNKVIFNQLLRYLNVSINGFKKTSNLMMLHKCFELEKQVAVIQKSPELLEHGQGLVDRLIKKSIQERSSGFIA
ncbi:hypothetical protein CANTEDRAFT_131014 [Yamadazyma tenuis ATCC 10573]|uniref:Anaphase-promoting complex subunit 5 n=2 Tax=Candida tenuis TaxID=2315449 RepID=G3BAK6_CANTC|nr:uncharacterized protein CANTEDRAFT_131014 [Yamadazyma tenuis ATCC 10573]EGV61427.1 hypothetical protein CANTEDRAFT_131014 [Yamadazyma tenuis ATCC 10573]